MKRTFRDIEVTAASMPNHARTFSPYDRNNDPGGYKQIIMAHSNGQPTSLLALNPLDPDNFDAAGMVKPMSGDVQGNPRITNPPRVYASFKLDKHPTILFEAPRQYSASFLLKSIPTKTARTGKKSNTQRHFDANLSENTIPLYALDPYGLGMCWTVIQREAALVNYQAACELTGDHLYHGIPKYNDTDNAYHKLFAQLKMFQHFKGWTNMDGATMINEPYVGKEVLQATMGNTLFNGIGSTLQSYHSMAQTMKGLYQAFNYWGNEGTDPGAALYFVFRGFEQEKYRGINVKDGEATISFAMDHANPQGYTESREYNVRIDIQKATRKFKSDDPDDNSEVPFHKHILPILPAAVAVPDGGPLTREYLRYKDINGRTRYGSFVYFGKCMRPSYFKDVKPPVKPADLRPLMDMRLINTKEVLHVLIDPDDSLHTIM
jgi:hypothetical protein